MAGLQDLMQAVSMVQPNAQASFPVMPNNGNPMGVYNSPPGGMFPQQGFQNNIHPIAPGQAAPVGTPPIMPTSPYPWLNPSPAMDNIQQFLATRRGALPNIQQPVMPQRMY